MHKILKRPVPSLFVRFPTVVAILVSGLFHALAGPTAGIAGYLLATAFSSYTGRL